MAITARVILEASSIEALNDLIATAITGGGQPAGDASASETIDTVAGATGVVLTKAKRCRYKFVAANTWLSLQWGVISA